MILDTKLFREQEEKIKLTTEQWLERRRTVIGGSDVAAILGYGKYKTSYEVWEEKIGVTKNHEMADNNYTRWGKALEPLIADEYARQNPRVKVIVNDDLIVHPEHPMLGGNVDRELVFSDGKLGILEIKTTVNYIFKSWGEQLPLEYFCQGVHYLGLNPKYTSVTYAIFILDRREIEYLTIEKTEEVEAYLLRQNTLLANWWNDYVVTKMPPPMIASDYEKVTEIDDNAVASDDLIDKTIEELLKTKATIAELEEIQARQEDRIKEHIGKRNVLVNKDGDIIVTWNKVETTRLDNKKLRQERPDIYQEYTTLSTFRKFHVKNK